MVSVVYECLLYVISCDAVSRVSIMKNAILNIDMMNSILANAPCTLIHNDCNPRNICLRKSPSQVKDEREFCRLCLYDWELAAIDVPQRDLAEFLTFTLMPTLPMDTRVELINFYRCNLERYSGLLYPMDRY